MTQRFTLDDVRAAYKPRDAWWTVLLVDPLAGRLVVPVANRTRITPNQLTWAAAVLGVGAALCFWQSSGWWFVAGAVLFHLSFVIDCMDGKLARLKRNGSVFGVWFDFLFDRIRDLLCALALFGGLARSQDEPWYLALGIVFVSVNLFRYLDASTVAKVRIAMNETILAACRESGVDPHRYLLPPDDDPDAGGGATPERDPATRGVSVPSLQADFYSRVGWYESLRDRLRRRRIRIHLFSGIEYQMTVFVVAPLLQPVWSWSVAVLTVLGAVALLAFEALLVGKLWLSTRSLPTVLARIRAEGAGGSDGGPAPTE